MTAERIGNVRHSRRSVRIRAVLKNHLPKSIIYGYRLSRSPKDLIAFVGFLATPSYFQNFMGRLRILLRLLKISDSVPCPHTQAEIVSFISAILRLPSGLEGSIVEAGCYKGGSTAKFSIAAKLTGRRLLVFDSFEGIPENEEHHTKDIFGESAGFKKGDYKGDLEEVMNNVRKFGEIDVCEFIKGWFDETMPNQKGPLAAVYLDVDLASSTRTCLKHLFPRISPNGILFSQDGHLPLVIEVFDDNEFWRTQVGAERPAIEGLRKKKLIKITK